MTPCRLLPHSQTPLSRHCKHHTNPKFSPEGKKERCVKVDQCEDVVTQRGSVWLWAWDCYQMFLTAAKGKHWSVGLFMTKQENKCAPACVCEFVCSQYEDRVTFMSTPCSDFWSKIHPALMSSWWKYRAVHTNKKTNTHGGKPTRTLISIWGFCIELIWSHIYKPVRKLLNEFLSIVAGDVMLFLLHNRW